MDLHSSYDFRNSQRVANRKERNKEIISLIKQKCREHGGSAIIGDGFVVVDTKKFEVKEK